MINRRILRIKAMQALYSYFIIKDSMVEVIESEINEKYALDPAVHDFKDKSQFDEKQRLIRDAFRETISGTRQKRPEADLEFGSEVQGFVSSYFNQLQNERKRIRKAMINEAEGIHDAYIRILLLLVAISFIEKQDREKNKKETAGEEPWHFHLADSKVARAILENPIIRKNESNPEYSWTGEIDEVRKWYREIICKKEEFIAYQATQESGFAEDVAIVTHLFKKVIFKNDIIENHFLEQDLYWNENKTILRNLVVKTVKSISEDDTEPAQLMELSLNKEDDFLFFEKLFDETIGLNEELEEIIEQKTRNWDVSRIASLDMIIMKMALTEMISFPSIPVKVSINEFIEISKIYSTPKSKQFINGILDVLANELTSEKRIRKSGRGLIDNK